MGTNTWTVKSSGGDYPSLQAAESDRDGSADFSSDGEEFVVDSGFDAGTSIWDGWSSTPTATNFITIRAASGHEHAGDNTDTSVGARVEVTGSAKGIQIVALPYTQIHNLRFNMGTSSGATATPIHYTDSNLATRGALHFVADGNLIYKNGAASTATNAGVHVQTDSTGSTATFPIILRNNLVYANNKITNGLLTDNFNGFNFNASTFEIDFLNCTTTRCANWGTVVNKSSIAAFVQTHRITNVKNCISIDNGFEDFGSLALSSGGTHEWHAWTSISEIANSTNGSVLQPGPGAGNSATVTDETSGNHFEGATPADILEDLDDNFFPKSGSDAIDNGTDLNSSDSFSDDAINSDRITWNIGALEILVVPPVIAEPSAAEATADVPTATVVVEQLIPIGLIEAGSDSYEQRHGKKAFDFSAGADNFDTLSGSKNFDLEIDDE